MQFEHVALTETLAQLARLQTEQREVLVLAAVEEMRYEEIARVLDIPVVPLRRGYLVHGNNYAGPGVVPCVGEIPAIARPTAIPREISPSACEYAHIALKAELAVKLRRPCRRRTAAVQLPTYDRFSRRPGFA